MTTKTKTQVFLIVALAAFALSLILSQKANPSIKPLFVLKRVQEKVFLKLKQDPQTRIDYMVFLLNNRLEELNAVVKDKNYQFVLPAASRYSTLAGQISDYIIANNMMDRVSSTRQVFESHYEILVDLYTFYPKNLANNGEWKYIQDDYNYLKIYLDKLSSVK